MTTPNEPNKTRTIPLHIADQAVAACEAEIQKLKEENARLKDKSACQTECLDAFDKENARLKAEVERLRKAGDALALEVIYFVGDYDPVGSESLRNWDAAKEGKPSV